MRNFRVILLFIVCLTTNLSHAGIFSGLIKKSQDLSKTNGESLSSNMDFLAINMKFLSLQFNLREALDELNKFDELNEVRPPRKIDANLASFHIYNYLSLLSEEELLIHMQTKASKLGIEPHLNAPTLNANKMSSDLPSDTFAFTFFLELSSSGTSSQRALVKAIIDLAHLKFSLLHGSDSPHKNKKTIVPRKFWSILSKNLSEEEMDIQTIFIDKMISDLLTDPSMPASITE